MVMRFHGLLLILTTGVLLAQAPPPAGAPGPGAQARPAMAALKTFLGLTDQQVEQLVQLRREQQETVRPIREQAAATQKALQDALAASSPDAAAVGKLTLDLRNLRQQVQQINENYRNQALGLLDDAQKAKLQNLQRLVRLLPAVHAATALNLLLPPPQRQGVAAQGAAARGALLRGRLGWRQAAGQ
jgi:Spy/CpxP family protein refolding chaperone